MGQPLLELAVAGDINSLNDIDFYISYSAEFYCFNFNKEIVEEIISNELELHLFRVFVTLFLKDSAYEFYY